MISYIYDTIRGEVIKTIILFSDISRVVYKLRKQSSNPRKQSKIRTHREIIAFILEQGTKICMSQRTIAKMTGYSASTIARSLASLEQEGLIKIKKGETKSIPDTIIYKSKKQVKRPVVEVLNGLLKVIKLLITDVSIGKRMKYKDDVVPIDIDPSKVLLYKKLPSSNVEFLVIKK